MGKITHDFTICQLNEYHPSKELDDRKKFLLSIMPEQTVCIDIVREAIMSNLSVNYKFVLAHPLFKDGSKIEVGYTRIVWRDPFYEHLVESSILTNIRYLKPDGSEGI